jgi:magnesium transporter
LILNNVVNDYAQFLFNYEISSDEMDIKVRENHENIYSTVANMKHRVIVIKRCTAAIREILMKISGKKMAAISDDCRASLLNILNQSQLVFNEIDSIRDMLNGLLSQIDYMLMHKMNKSIQILTAFAAIFLPLTLITGIYGMNFQHIPELAWKYGYVYALALILACGILLVLLFKVKKWF